MIISSAADGPLASATQQRSERQAGASAETIADVKPYAASI